jgi:hypothetical protein
MDSSSFALVISSSVPSFINGPLLIEYSLTIYLLKR